LKKPAGSVRFRFYKQKTKPKQTKKPEKNRAKTEPNRKNRAKPKKPSQTEKTEPNSKKTKPNRFEPVFALENQTRPNRNRSV
jgi:hypothetical protein